MDQNMDDRPDPFEGAGSQSAMRERSMASLLEPSSDDRNQLALHDKLFDVLAEVEGAVKNANNDHFGNRYAKLENVIDVVKPACLKHGAMYRQQTVPHQHGIRIKTWFLVKGGVSEILIGDLYMPAPKENPQGFGSAMTYCRRYALACAFNLRMFDDDGEAARAGQATAMATNDPFQRVLTALEVAADRGQREMVKAYQDLRKDDPETLDEVWNEHGGDLQERAAAADAQQ